MSSPNQVEDNNTNKISSNNDPIIGLDVCGKVYYCRQSTLTNASPYFASRFKGDFDAAVSFVDEHGRNVYFLERSQTTFQYIFDYLVSGSTAHIPPFSKDPTLIRSLRLEADYFGLDELRNHLMVSKSFAPKNMDSRGLLYWLGTRNRGTVYQNPFSIGEIHVHGWMEDMGNRRDKFFSEANAFHCRAKFVQYREPLRPVHCRGWYEFHCKQSICGGCWQERDRGIPAYVRLVVFELKTVKLRPTHYSLRASRITEESQCGNGMASANWSFEASEDGEIWKELHCVNDSNRGKVDLVRHPFIEEFYSEKMRPKDDEDGLSNAFTAFSLRRAEVDKNTKHTESIAKQLETFLETECRETWQIEPLPQTFYQYFRIRGDSQSCMHCEGIEFYGDVYEE